MRATLEYEGRRAELLHRLRVAQAELTRRQYSHLWRYRDNPVGFMQDILGIVPWSKQREIAESVRDSTETSVRACHGPGKSLIAAALACWWESVHPPGDAFVVSTAPGWSQVRAILWRYINRLWSPRLPGRLNQTEWWMPTFHGEEMVGYGRKPADTAATGFQGVHANHVLVIVDESSGVPEALNTAVDTLMTGREESMRRLNIGNPDDPTGWFARTFKPNHPAAKIAISVYDTPWFTDEHEELPEATLQGLVHPDWVRKRVEKGWKGTPLWDSKVLGRFPAEGRDTLIPLWQWERACRRWPFPEVTDESIPVGTPVIEAVDVARFGDAETAFAVRAGGVGLIYDAYRGRDTTYTTDVARFIRRETGAEEIRVDDVGVGGGVTDQLQAAGEPVRAMIGNATPVDAEMFVDARTEWAWALREAFDADGIACDPADEELGAQVTSMKYSYKKGKLYLESKEDRLKRGLPSPDRFDTLSMAWAELGSQIPREDVETLTGSSFYK